MKKWLSNLLLGLLLVAGLGLLYLAIVGAFSFDKPFVYRLMDDLPESGPLVAFEHVSVIPMDRELVLEDQTVLVRDGLIETVADSALTSTPASAMVIDGRGKYLLPGLVDMHAHIQFENDLLLWVANGVTSVRNMWGHTGKMLQLGFPDHLAIREQIEQGALFGPTIYTAGPVMEGSPAFHPLAEVFDTPEAARESVAWQKAQGYDLIKVYDHLSPEVYQTILETAAEQDLAVVGHVPLAAGLDYALAGGQQTIEHMSGYIDPDAEGFIIPVDQLTEYALKTREAGVWNVVTLSEYPKSKETTAGIERLESQPGMAYLTPFWKLLTPFFYKMTANAHTYRGADYRQRIAALNRDMVTALHEAEAGILLGTDAAQSFHIPGFSIHEELALLVETGLRPYEALEAGMRNAAMVLGKSDEFGTIDSGKRADLILLEANPLTDIGNVQKRAGVMLRGRWLAEGQLQTTLEGLVESFRPALVERLWPLTIIGLAIYLIWRNARQLSNGGYNG